ncbi:MAG: FxsA family protein [Propionicimonas sp.]|uniref:FxsA family protein n=1 Tax=Propionicimonas sp. TaxID=1955623 RepID=UPI003D0C51A8
MTMPVQTRRPWLLPALVGVFILVAVAEVWLLTFVGVRIGVLPTLLILVAEAVLGAWLMRREGRKAWQALVDAYSTGRLPSGQLADAALILVGGIMLILPGFFTDIIGLVFLLPWTRPLARRAVGMVIARHSATLGLDLSGTRSPFNTGTVVPGETVDGSTPPASASDAPQVIRGEIED